jgi:hypothetical protein
MDWTERRISADKLDGSTWSTIEWIHFLRSLPNRLPADRLAELDRAFHLTERGNAEIAQQWLVLAVQNHYEPANARLETFLMTIGRRKFLVPLYEELLKTPEGVERAKSIYGKARSFYDPIVADSLEMLMRRKSR